ncbi:MAG: MerC domain-containing protein, partial [SAR324 cluster bacterium]|nr:MerC domain-containing protein [SAR324 cluster bacterium]
TGEPERKQTGVAEDEAQGQESRNPVFLLAGLLGTVFATLCCIGIAPLVALVMAIGLGFMLTLTILLPLLIVSLLIGGYGLWRSWRRHGNPYPLLLHGLSGALVAVLIYFILHDLPVIWVGLAGVLAAALWNIRLEYVYWHREPEVDFSRTG